MAARLDLYAVDGDHDRHDRPSPEDLVAMAATPDATALGWLAAGDDDEQLLFDVLVRIGERTGTFAVRDQGAGVLDKVQTTELAAALDGLDASLLQGITFADVDRAICARWLDTLAACVQGTVDRGRGLGFSLRYDRAGTTDDGPDEYATGAEILRGDAHAVFGDVAGRASGSLPDAPFTD